MVTPMRLNIAFMLRRSVFFFIKVAEMETAYSSLYTSEVMNAKSYVSGSAV